MKRLLLIGTLVVMAALLLAIPATAKKPPPDDPPPEPAIECIFDVDGELGVLWVAEEGGNPTKWDGSGHIRCRLEAKPSDSFTFVMESTGATTVLHPYLAVTDVYPHSGNRCYVHYETGRQAVDEEGAFATFTINALDTYGDPTDGVCGGDRPDTDGPGVYALTVSVQKTWGGDGTVQLSMSD